MHLPHQVGGKRALQHTDPKRARAEPSTLLARSVVGSPWPKMIVEGCRAPPRCAVELLEALPSLSSFQMISTAACQAFGWAAAFAWNHRLL